MTSKKFILNAEDFGMSKAFNRGVLDGYHNGFLTSASLSANGKAFNAAVNEIIPECPNLSIGIHLNLTQGRALTKANKITNKKGKFNKNFFQILLLANNKKVLEQIEFEFRTQIETVKNYAQVDHIDSLEDIHAIPAIFNITAKLAKEYNIPFIRTHFEEMYIVKDIFKHLHFKYLMNLFKMFTLNNFTKKNKIILKNYGLKTNDNIIGIAYSELMDESTIEEGLKMIDEAGITEVIIHPAHYAITNKNQHYKEFLLTQNKSIKDKIIRLGFDITNYKKEKQSNV